MSRSERRHTVPVKYCDDCPLMDPIAFTCAGTYPPRMVPLRDAFLPKWCPLRQGPVRVRLAPKAVRDAG